jgi:translation initiation factor 2 gamma subunit (eIF-2gamma)
VDRGLVFIEPQYDDEIKVRPGISYSEANDYKRPDYNDTITNVVVAW